MTSGALPPYPCRHCEEDVATEVWFPRHVADEHAGMREFWKSFFWLLSRVEGIRLSKPEAWRWIVEGSTGALITGQSKWPECPVAPAGEAHAA